MFCICTGLGIIYYGVNPVLRFVLSEVFNTIILASLKLFQEPVRPWCLKWFPRAVHNGMTGLAYIL